MFLPLYPLGFYSEGRLIFDSLPTFKASPRKFSIAMPNVSASS
jgi:hypothetical protein